MPEGGLILTAGADVQKDRIEVDVWAWGRGLESWLVDHVVIDGGPESAAAWSALAVLLSRTWPHALGAELQIARLAVDTGYEAPAVYAWARAQGFAQVAPIKGVEGFNRASPVSGPTYVDATIAGKRLRRGARLWTVAVSTFKAETYRFLRLVRPTGEEIAGGARMPPGTIHLPDWVEAEWLKQFVAEQLEKVNQSGEFKRGTIGEAQETYRIETFGKVIGITRQVLINDDLDAFTRVPALFGTSAATLESDVVWGIFTANPAMADGATLFHASHKNLAGSGAALDVAGLAKARTAMAQQRGLDGKTLLNVRPSYLVVPSALELTAEQLLAQNIVPAKAADVVPSSIRSLAVIAEPRLDPASGAVPWFLVASPAAIDTIEYAYLEGQEGVALESRMGFDVDGVEVRARLDFGAKAIDWRGLHKNPGVALS